MIEKDQRTEHSDETKYDEIDDIGAQIEAMLMCGDLNAVNAALGKMARAQGMTDVARKTGLGRESLYKSLSENGNPEFATIMKVVRALGLQLRVK